MKLSLKGAFYGSNKAMPEELYGTQQKEYSFWKVSYDQR